MKKILALFVLLCCFSVQADPHGEGPCAKDREIYCKEVTPGEGRLMKCMKENQEKFSAECKNHRAEMKKSMQEMKEACHEDMEKLCGDVKAGRGRIAKCMKEHKDQLSESCQSEMSTRRKKMHHHE